MLFFIVLCFARVCVRVCVIFFLLLLILKSKVRNDCPTVQSIRPAEYLRRHDINFVTSCFDSGPIWITRGPIWVHARADMDHARANMGSREWADMAFASRAISTRVTKQIVKDLNHNFEVVSSDEKH